MPAARVAKGSRGEALAPAERTIPDARDAFVNRNLRKVSALIERLLPDACDAIGDHNRRKALALAERPVPDARKPFCEDHLLLVQRTA